jgi:alpha/beta hydrolase fold
MLSQSNSRGLAGNSFCLTAFSGMIFTMPQSPASLAYVASPVVDSVRSRFVDTATGLRMHVLEAGTPGQPAVLMLHGFPELAYSWRHQLPALAAAGYHAIAPDQRGYGRTTGWDARFEADLAPYRLFNLAQPERRRCRDRARLRLLCCRLLRADAA